MIAVTFALPQESSDFRSGLRDVRPAGGVKGKWLVGECGNADVLVGHTGVGCAVLSQELPAAISEYRPDAVISAGFAGGIDPRLKLGDVIVATNFSDPTLIDRIRDLLTFGGYFFGPLHTAIAPVETIAEKSHLA